MDFCTVGQREMQHFMWKLVIKDASIFLGCYYVRSRTAANNIRIRLFVQIVHLQKNQKLLLLLAGLQVFFVVYGIISLYALIGLLLAALPFGPDAMFWNHFTSTTAEPAPVGESPAQNFQAQPKGGLVDPGLAHSGIYMNPVAITQIISWIKDR